MGRGRYGFALLTAALLTAALTIAGTATVAAPAQAGPPSRPPAGPALLRPRSQDLNSVYCTASTTCWAVGFKETSKHAAVNQIVRWNGRKWTAVSAPSPGGTKMNAFSELFAVRCTSASNCWAVGIYQGAQSQLAQTLHWNGSKWAQVSIPEPGGTHEGQVTDLIDVACTSANDCWAVGEYGARGIGSVVGHNFAIRWTGKKWFKVKAPNPAGTKQNDVNSLDAVRCTSIKDCWAGGTAGVEAGAGIQLDEMLHWNGTKWSQADVPSPAGFMVGAFNEINGLSCTSASDCWAIGSYGGGSVSDETFLNMALHWNGHKWTQAMTPNPDGTGSNDSNVLNGVSCSAANNCWAVGTFGTISVSNSSKGEALHWKGSTWTKAKAPNPGGTAGGDQNSYNSVRCVSAKDCWIVGFSRNGSNPDLDLTLHWNSTKWSVQPSN
ncbi:MAG TPA: hypothetical protein VGM14_05605 [Streptosporangiaceae bacterium]|jgi:hypothetical protein